MGTSAGHSGRVKRGMRQDWWKGPGRYLLLCGALFALMLPRSWTDAWRGDFWVHLPAVEELAARPLDPHHPLFGNDQPYVFLSPYAWVLGLASRLTGLRPDEVLVLQGFVNLALLLGALYAFAATWLSRRSAAFYALLFMLFLWGRDPWVYSSFFHLRSLAFVLPYPSTLAGAVALGCLAAFPRAVRSGSVAWAACGVPVLAMLWIVHPVNALFLCSGLLACCLETSRPRRQWAALASAVALSVALALAWPLFPVGRLWFGEREAVDAGNDVMYSGMLSRIGPALLGVPWLLVRLKRNARDPLSLLAFILALFVVYGGAAGAWSYGRLVSHAVLVLHVALADASAAVEERLARLPAGAVLSHLLAPSVAAVLLASSWSATVRPTFEEGGRGNPRWLSFLEHRVERDDVVLTDLDTCWYVPSFSGKVVAYPMHIPFVPDHHERVGAVTRFFAAGVPREERLEIIRRYEVGYVLVAKGHFVDWQALLAELQPLGRVVYSSPEHALLQVTAGVGSPRRKGRESSESAQVDDLADAGRPEAEPDGQPLLSVPTEPGEL